MLVIDSIDKAIAAMKAGYCLVQCSMRYSKLTTEILVCGRLMGWNASNWWYVVESTNNSTISGVVNKDIFRQLYKSLYVREASDYGDSIYYTLNHCCSISDVSQYRHKIDCWGRFNSVPESE